MESGHVVLVVSKLIVTAGADRAGCDTELQKSTRPRIHPRALSVQTVSETPRIPRVSRRFPLIWGTRAWR